MSGSLVVGVLIGVTAWGTLHVKHESEAAVAAERDLQAAVAEMHVQDGLEWRVVSGRAVPDEVAGKLAESRRRWVVLVERAVLAGSDPVAARQELVALHSAYTKAVDQELRLIGEDSPEAEEFDEQHVDPAFEALAHAMAEESREQAAHARTAMRLGDAGLLLGVVLALTLVALVQRRQRRDEVRREVRLREQGRYRALVQQSVDLVLVTDRLGRVTYRGPAADRALGSRPGHVLLDRMVADDRERVRSALVEVAAARVVTFEARLETVSGVRVVEWSLRDLTDDPDVQGVVWTGHDVSDRHSLQTALEHRATHDALTGLPNRVLLADRFEQVLHSADETGSETGLLLIDLDRFKEINDTLGHEIGDALLIQVGRRLTETVRREDIVARLGGDEFAVLLPRVDGLTEAMAIANEVHAAVASTFFVDGAELDIDASIGVVLSGRDGTHPATLLQRADIAMYAAKQAGVPTAAYDREADLHSPERLSLLGDLRRALNSDTDELFLVYQPKIDLRSGRVCGAEALLRWRHPDRGMIGPDTFIPLAENTGLIARLSALVLDRALAQASRWHQTGQTLPVAVNVSARNLVDEALVPLVAELLDKHRVPAQLLTLEVTETAIMSDSARSVATLHRLRDLGVVLAIDDFGVGYTSLAQLKSLPVSELKVDRTFIQAMAADGTDTMIVRSIVDLGHNLGLTTVAEGVESVEALHDLLGYTCDVVQGYHLSPPLAPDELDAWRTRWPGLRPTRRRGGASQPPGVPRPRTAPSGVESEDRS